MQLKSGSTVGGNLILVKAGTNNYIPKFGSDNNLINSLLQDDGTDVKIGNNKIIHAGNVSNIISVATTTSAGLMSADDKIKLDGLLPGGGGGDGYTHPVGDGYNHVPATGTTNNNKVLKAGPNAGDNLWGWVDWTELISKPTTFNPPIASSSLLGGIKVGSGLSIDPATGILSTTGGGGSTLPTLIASRAISSDSSGNIVASVTTATELSYLNGVTSAIQTQLNNKQATITGAATTITGSDLTFNLALISNGTGKVATSATTATELGYLSGVTSSVQTQINSKQDTIAGAATTITSANLSANLALVSNASGKVSVSTATATELGYLSGVTSSIQTQLNNKQASITGAATTIATANLTINKALISDVNGKVVASNTSAQELLYLVGVTSAVQNQLDNKQATVVGAASTIVSSNLTTNKAVMTDGNGKITTSPVSVTELGYLSGVSSALQTQLNNKSDISHNHDSTYLRLSGGTMTGGLNITGGSIVMTAVSAGIEIGNTTVSNTPFLDFHSGGSAVDYDSRIIASGGNSATGNGTLSFQALSVNTSGKFQPARLIIPVGVNAYAT